VKRRTVLAHAVAGGLVAAIPLTSRAQTPPRIVAVGGAITEVIYALGAENLLVAVDSTSLFPEAAKALPQVGYMRAISAEGVLALRPTLVIATTAGGPATSFEQIKATGVQIMVLPDHYDYDSVVLKFEAIGKAIGKEKEAEALIARGRADMEKLAVELAKVGGKPRVMFLLGLGGGAPQAAGQNTAAEGIIKLAGGSNAIEGYQGYRPLTPEAAIASRPDVIVLTHQTVTLIGKPEAVFDQQPALRQTRAGKSGRVVAYDAGLLLGFGPRTPQAARDLAVALHPSIAR
jgi:iron complex transport system substrate-binding protein